MLIVLGSISGAFILSYGTPTVGLGCRSGGYLIYAMAIVMVFAMELLVWGYDATRHSLMNSGSRDDQEYASRSRVCELGVCRWIFFPVRKLDGALTHAHAYLFDKVYYMNPGRFADAEADAHKNALYKSSLRRIEKRHDWGILEWSERCFFRPLEILITIWLIYIVMAQMVGAYRTCNCMSSSWGLRGGTIHHLFETR